MLVPAASFALSASVLVTVSPPSFNPAMKADWALSVEMLWPSMVKNSSQMGEPHGRGLANIMSSAASLATKRDAHAVDAAATADEFGDEGNDGDCNDDAIELLTPVHE